MEQLQNSGV